MNSDSTVVKHIASIKAESMLPYVQTAGYFLSAPSYVIKRKKYDSILIIYTICGKGYLKYGNKEYMTEKDSVIIMDCNQPHVYYTDKIELWNMLWVHFKGGQSMEQTAFILENNGPLLKLGKDNSVKNDLYKILNISPQTGIYSDIMLAGLLNGIVNVFMLKSLHNPGSNNHVVPEIVNKAISMIKARYAENITLDALSRDLFANKYTLIKQFKKYIGMTPYVYLIKYRIRQAKSLLENTPLTILEVAQKVGFQDMSYFIRTFKEHENITPLAYRKYSFKKQI